MGEEGGKWTRRSVLSAVAAAGGADVAAALTADGDGGSIHGGNMALQQEYNVAEDLWIGPDSARSNVSADSGRVYIGTSGSGYTFYNGDGGSWTSKGLGDSSDPLPSVNTESASIGAYTGADAGAGSEGLISQKSQWQWSPIPWEDKGEPIIDGSSINGSAGYGTLLHGPTVFDNPIDEWYCYWSSHDFNDIGLSTAPDLWGSWTEHGSVFSDPAGGQTASPSATYLPENSRTNFYYHVNDAGQYTKLAYLDEASDGTTFNIQGTVLNAPFNAEWYENEVTYLRVYRRAGEFVGVFQGRDKPNNAPGIGVVHSSDGENWHMEPNPCWDNTHWTNYSPRSFVGGSPILADVGGRTDMLYQDRGTGSIHALPFESRDSVFFSEGEVVYEQPSWATGNAIIPCELASDGLWLYLLYHDNDLQDISIGIARVKMEEIA